MSLLRSNELSIIFLCIPDCQKVTFEDNTKEWITQGSDAYITCFMIDCFNLGYLFTFNSCYSCSILHNTQN